VAEHECCPRLVHGVHVRMRPAVRGIEGKRVDAEESLIGGSVAAR
jgi:hypothetical protein